MKWTIFVCILVVLFLAEGKQLSRCELIRELRSHRLPGEKNKRLDIVSKQNSNGSRDYGFFEINDKYWCSNSSNPGKDCNVTCKQLLTENISKAASCAKKIYQRHGFDAWYG